MLRSRKILIYILFAIATFLILGGATRLRWRQRETNVTVNYSQTTATEYVIPPEVTDPEIDDWLEPHYVAIDKSVTAKQKLFLFFSGTYGHPGRQRLVTQQAATRGYHAINLRYPNSNTVGYLCRGSRDPDCHEKVRLEIIDGLDRSDNINVKRVNSIENRLVKLLIHLNRKQPEQEWLNYLEGNTPKWSSIVVAGHSQGSGHAAMIAHQHQVARVIMFGGPSDFSRVLRSPAPWFSKPSATPANRYYGFVHLQDRGLKKIIWAWRLLGMSEYGEAVNVDFHLPPYQNSRQLVTNVKPTRPGKYHGSVVTDHSTPLRRNGRPSFEDVWQYLCDF